MVITTREINGIHCAKRKRYLDIDFEHNGTKVNVGLLDYEERIELAEHLKDVVDDLLYQLEGE